MSCHEITIRDRKVEFIDRNIPIKWTNNRYNERLVHECEDQVISTKVLHRFPGKFLSIGKIK